ncbi:HIT domain-containing protein [Perlucidibaca piscinae]|uniref:HIT domain-containing protein n=1 Tax=Perlucidibaca piscinae TaxID=392589 RepID=UPI0003B515D8|nr:HIT domain-containing protein [Perlucidibaca piscinae]
MFTLHPRLAADTVVLGDFPLSQLLLMNDASYPWLILVPRRADIREVHELSDADQLQLIRESSWVSERLALQLQATKMNVANLGNMVPQLHWHVIARFEGDPAWPKPVWGQLPAEPYTDEELLETLHILKSALPVDGRIGLNWAL